MTDLEQRAIRALRDVRVPAKNWHGTRIEALNMRLTVIPEAGLGITDQADLWFLVWRYRLQIDDAAVVAYADDLVNGTRSLNFS